MRTKWWMLVGLAAVLIACAPSVSSREAWGRAVFSPSSSSERAACDAGYQYGQTTKAIQTVGLISFSTPRGSLRLLTRLAKLHFLCNSIGLFNGRKPETYSDVFNTDVGFEDATMVGRFAKVSFSLEDEKGSEFARLTAEQTETEKNRQWYARKSYSATDLAALDKAASFSIIIERGSGEERYKVTQGFQPYGPSANANIQATGILSQRALAALSKGQ